MGFQQHHVCFFRQTSWSNGLFFKELYCIESKFLAPVEIVNITVLTRFYTSQVVQDFFHQQNEKTTASHPGLVQLSSCLGLLTFFFTTCKCQRDNSQNQRPFGGWCPWCYGFDSGAQKTRSSKPATSLNEFPLNKPVGQRAWEKKDLGCTMIYIYITTDCF